MLKYIPFEQWRSQGRIFGGGQNRITPWRTKEVNQGIISGGKLQNGGGARGRGI